VREESVEGEIEEREGGEGESKRDKGRREERGERGGGREGRGRDRGEGEREVRERERERDKGRREERERERGEEVIVPLGEDRGGVLLGEDLVGDDLGAAFLRADLKQQCSEYVKRQQLLTARYLRAATPLEW
jgi:hypothetical protein